MSESKRGRPRSTPLSPFGEALRAAIAQSHFKNREAFRRAANIPTATLYVYETQPGRHPRGEELQRWANLLEVPVGALTGGAPLPPPDSHEWIDQLFREWNEVGTKLAAAYDKRARDEEVPGAAAAVLQAFDATKLGAAFSDLRRALNAIENPPKEKLPEIQKYRLDVLIADLRIAIVHAEAAFHELAGALDHDLTPLTEFRVRRTK